jgi:hypothetical protein
VFQPPGAAAGWLTALYPLAHEIDPLASTEMDGAQADSSFVYDYRSCQEAPARLISPEANASEMAR